jgi:hypothetical protein
VSLHPADIEEATDALSIVGRQVRGVQCMNGEVNGMSKRQRNGNPKRATALNVNIDTTAREGTEGGSNVTKSLRNVVKLIVHAESITQKMIEVTTNGDRG